MSERTRIIHQSSTWVNSHNTVFTQVIYSTGDDGASGASAVYMIHHMARDYVGERSGIHDHDL